MRDFYGIISSIFLLLFALFGYLAQHSFVFPGDVAVSLWLQSINFPGFYPLMLGVSYVHSLFPATTMVALGSAGLWFWGKKLEVIFIVSLTSLANLLVSLFKLVVSRPRPGGEIQVLAESTGFSFPSGHIVYATVFYGFLFYLAPKLIRQPAIVGIVRVVLVLLILLTATSRIYLGAHWLSDVLGSFWLSGLLLSITIYLHKIYSRVMNA